MVAEHTLIIEGIASGDAFAAERGMLQHLEAAYLNVGRAVEVYQQYFAPAEAKSSRR